VKRQQKRSCPFDLKDATLSGNMPAINVMMPDSDGICPWFL